MKKNLSYILLLFFFLSPYQIWASECSQSCRIEDAPAPALTEYLTNLDTIRDNILDALSEVDAVEGGSMSQERNRVIAGFNSLLSFRDYFGSFDYYISLPITNEVPQEVRRDHTRIINQTERFTRILETAERRATASTQVENICTGVSYCTLGTGTAQSFLVQIIQNNQKVAQIYRASILEKPELATERDLILVAPDFISEIESHYNKDTLTSCSACDEGFLDTIRESIRNISFKNSDYKEGVQKWKDAWAMLRGGRANPGYTEREAELTREYLQSQGMESEQGHIILDTQGRYDAGGLSSSDPLANASEQSQVQTTPRPQSFQEMLREKLGSGEDKIPYAEVTRVDTQIRQESDIAQSIGSLYDDQLPFAFVQDTAAQELQSRIIRMHFDLITTANLLGRQVQQTERLCDRQATGRGRCSYR